jgi:hypothetical protein
MYSITEIESITTKKLSEFGTGTGLSLFVGSGGDGRPLTSLTHMLFIYFGYIVRLVNSNQNIDLMFTQNTLKVVIGQQLTNIVFSLDANTLLKKWSHFSLTVDAGKQAVSLKVNGQTMGTQTAAIKNRCFQILWGANDHHRFNTRDLPPMQVKDIRLLDEGKEKYYWSLADTSGVTSTDSRGLRKAAIKNPVWIKPKHQRWQQLENLVLNGNAAIAFDPVGDRLYIGRLTHALA